MKQSKRIACRSGYPRMRIKKMKWSNLTGLLDYSRKMDSRFN